MNILILSWRDPRHPLAGGAEQVVLEHCKGWIQAGYNVTWFSSRFNSSPIQDEIDGVFVIRDGGQYLGVQIKAFFYYLKNKDKFDLVVDQFHGIPFFTPLYVRKPILALIQEVAGKVWLLNPLPFPLNLIVGVVGYLLEPFVFLLYKNTQFMTGSESAKNEVSRLGIPLSNITVVPHGVILPTRKLKRELLTPPVVTYLGIISRDKGVEDVLKTFAILASRSNYQFWIVGKPETPSYMEKILLISKRLGLDGKIKFWGYVSQDKKFELLSKSNVLVNPSVHEGWGLVNIEANVVGTPVVCYNSAGLIDSVSDGQSGIVLKINTPLEMANVVQEIIGNNELFNKLKIGSEKWSRNFTWKASRVISLKLVQKLTN